MKIPVDLHTHTLASGHAYSSLSELIAQAKKKKLTHLGISDHAPGLPGTTHPFYFQNFKVIPRRYGNLKLLCGAEVNIMDLDGTFDLAENELKLIDYGIASLHHVCLESGSIDENSNAIIKAMSSPYIQIIGHPDDHQFQLDYERVVYHANKEHILLEINASSLAPNSFRINAHKNISTMLSYCKKMDAPIIIGSDAHIASDVGNFHHALELIKSLDFPSTLISNMNKSLLAQYINI